ncbi:plexin-B3 isoform X1 [Dunckerocampus dactyliophorus]|uniref:plexin-B3 isoform X1 n=2 Tax=Dunckerocampus dactyliophorus TaxID=161453 RepID=UPI002406A6D1|nr:plexin-B3 isoform X1 [Dunckerocampus dactyliophorus]XP_054645227.1 plexin-B3 isoform X1 [Dunckerocampus dactyliophorus]XP_054646078.1 plexin-B3 isoform X1 [Dunckerocampus dactyliophorus]XP_054646906.1 plexin-B3 isoform X1 [Dunckerocampus dactyliophorus]XP_054647728.1 plexin-B3 isoform X1 [Dunckerocampus dactyliophorus]
MLASSAPPSLLLLFLFLPTPLTASDSSVRWVNLRGAPLCHLLLDAQAGLLYVGGVDHLYQLTSDLQLMSHVKTGPHLDSVDCVPPISLKDCPSAKPTSNHNKLLLLEAGQGTEPGSLIVCGSLYYGICEKRSLSNISQLVYQSSNPLDNQFVAANDPFVSTVGIVLTTGGGASGQTLRFMLVGRGYTSKGFPFDIPPITTRRLYPVVPPHRAFVQEEELGRLFIGSYSKYDTHFIKVVALDDHVYFLFSRVAERYRAEYRTYVSRLCISDRKFYSYVEVPLLCHGGYNLARGAWLGRRSGKPALFVTMTAGWASTSMATDNSALCVYGMAELDAMIKAAKESCYTRGGHGVKGQEEAYIAYSRSYNCLNLPKASVSQCPCGCEHTPNPIASVNSLVATPAFTATTQLTAVATTTETGHTVAFVGDREGRLHKVLVRSDGSGEVYGSVLVDSGSPVSTDLLLDASQQNLFVLTSNRLSKVPVSSCQTNTDCQSCLATKDLYCGWCVLEGRCSRQHECERHLQANHWIWSFDSSKQCMIVQSVQPANQSKDEQTQVTLSLAQLPVLSATESLSCVFNHLPPQPAFITGISITCQSPAPELLPPLPTGSDHMILPVLLTFGHVTITTANMTFYDCGAVSRLNQTSQCLACVDSMWKCNWCPLDQQCTHRDTCPNQHIILNQRESPGPGQCPLVFGLQSSALVPVGLTSRVVLKAQNLHVYKDEAQYVCVVDIEGVQVNLTADVQKTHDNTHTFTCSPHQFDYAVSQLVYSAAIFLRTGTRRIDALPGLQLQLYNCSVGQSDCSQCWVVPKEYGCVWCTGSTAPSCVYNQTCNGIPADTCPPPEITQVHPLSGPLEGGVLVTISGSNLGMSYHDVVGGVTVAGVQCPLQPEEYKISTRVVCMLQASQKQRAGPVLVTTGKGPPGTSAMNFNYQDPRILSLLPDKGPLSGGTRLTIKGRQLSTGQTSHLNVFLGTQPCYIVEEVSDSQLVCQTLARNQTGKVPIRVLFSKAERSIPNVTFRYVDDPVITDASPAESFYAGGRVILVSGRNLDVVQQPIMSVWVEPVDVQRVRRRKRLALLSARQQVVVNTMETVSEHCSVLSPSQMTCPTPSVPPEVKVKGVWFQMDNVRVRYESIKGKRFTYHPNPRLFPLNREAPDAPYYFKAGGVLAVEGEDLTRAMSRQEVTVLLGDQECEVKTLDSTHLYCEPPEVQPMSVDDSSRLPRLQVLMGHLQVDLGMVQYDSDLLMLPIPLAAQISLGAGAAVILLSVLVVILMYRRKSKQALRDYKKVLLQLETLEINVGDQCRKEFTDLMTEMMDLSSDVGGPGLPLLDYRTYAERVFFPGHQAAPLSRHLDLPEFRRQTVEQGLQQLNNLLNNRLFLTRFIHTLEAQQGFSQRDRGYVASLLTMALHDKLEYFTEVMKSLLQDLVQQYVAKNPKLMLRRTETVVEKMLTNWMSICLYSFLKEVAGEPLYMLYRAIKYQVDKGPVDAVTGKAKRTLNDSHLLREDIDYCAVTLTVLVKNGAEVQPCPVKVLDTDTITQVKDKILDQVYRGAAFSQRPAADNLDLEWRSGQAGHLTLSDDDVTAVVQGRWKRLNTLQHYKVPDGATVALVPRSQSSSGTRVNQVFQTGEKTPMLESEEEEGLRLWHLVKSSEDSEIPKHRKSSMRERERAKAIPEIYLTRLLSMKGTLQKFVDDVFVAILSTKRPPPIAVRFFFDFLDDMAEKHGIDDPETVHIWKTNSLPLRFWVNILKNPQFVLDVQVTDSIDAVLSVIAQTFIDSCTTSEHKVGRDSPVNKLLYAREIPRYKQLVERYYSDIHSAASGCYQEMNSTLTELSGSFASEMNSLVALHELYKYINKYYDQVIMSLEEDNSGQKMQLAYRLQQVAALVENKVTDL